MHTSVTVLPTGNTRARIHPHVPIPGEDIILCVGARGASAAGRRATPCRARAHRSGQPLAAEGRLGRALETLELVEEVGVDALH